MSTRVSTTEVAQSSLYGIQDAYSRFDVAQQKVNTGKQVQRPSDDPSGTSQALDFRERNTELDQFSRNIDQANSFIATSETALDSVSSLTRQARTIAVQAASDNVSPETRTALSTQLQNIITQIASLGNTQLGSRYIFAGQRTTTAPLVAVAGIYNYLGGTSATGDGDLYVDIGRGESLKTNATGDKVFIPLLATLQTLANDVGSGNVSLISYSDLNNLDTVYNNVNGVRADLGAKVNRLDLTKSRNEVSKVNYTKFISQIEDTDFPSAVVNLQSAQTAYQAAVQSTARAYQNSLLDYLK